MRKLLVALVLLGVADRGLGQETTAKATKSHPSRVEHLLKAAEHLEAAGLSDEARGIRRQIEREEGATAAGAPGRQAETERNQALGTSGQSVLLRIRVIEIARTKLRQLGLNSQRACSAQGGPSGVDGALMALDGRSSYLGARASNDAFLQVLDALLEQRLAKVLAEPTLATVSNRPAIFHAGGECRVAVPRGDGTASIEERPYGTLVRFLPIVLPDQTVQLTCRIELSNPDQAHSFTIAGETAPVLSVMAVDTGGNFRSGQTVVLGGLRQQRRAAPAPIVADSAGAAPCADGSPHVKEVVEEFETLVLLTPEIVEPMVSENAARLQSRR